MNIVNHLKKKNYALITGLAWVVVFILLAIFSKNNFLKQKLDQYLYDYEVILSADKLAPDNITIIDVDEKSLKAEGRWPWNREKIATLIDILSQSGAVVVAMDMIFSEPTENPVEQIKHELNMPKDRIEKLSLMYDQDLLFSKSLGEVDAVLGFVLHHDKTIQTGMLPAPISETACTEIPSIYSLPGYTANLPQLQSQAKGGGFVTSLRDSDGVVRRVPLVLCHDGKLYPSLSLAALKEYFLSDSIQVITEKIGDEKVISQILLDKFLIPTDEHGQVLVNFLGKSKTFHYVSATDILNHHFDDTKINGAIIFIGTSALGLSDLQAVPHDSTFPGVEVHANVAASILSQHIRQLPAWHLGAELFYLFSLGVALVVILSFLPPIGIVVSILLSVGMLFAYQYYLFDFAYQVISFSYLYILMLVLMTHYLFLGFFHERKSKKHIQTLFGQYVPPLHVEKMSENPDKYTFEGESKELTVLFCDIRNFTHYSESLEADQVKQFLNEYFTPMTKIIFDSGGTIDKYIGDMIMAFWGAPLSDDEQRTHALEAALSMRDFSDWFLKRSHDPKLGLGIGINTGYAHVGDMGSAFRRSYTVLGDTVNLASRLESATKFYGVSTIVSEETAKEQYSYLFRPLDKVRVVGKEKAVNIYELVGRTEDIPYVKYQEIEYYKQALAAFYTRDWRKAEMMFQSLSETYPKMKLYQRYLARMQHFKRYSPNSDWDGIFDLEVK